MSYRDTILSRNPISYWRLGETSGAFVDTMSVKNLTPYGNYTRGEPGPAVVDDMDFAIKLNNYAYLSAEYTHGEYDFDPAVGMKVEAWVKCPSVNTPAFQPRRTIFYITSNTDESPLGGNKWYELAVWQSGNLYAYAGNWVGSNYVYSLAKIVANTWHHIVCEFKLSQITIWMDDVIVATSGPVPAPNYSDNGTGSIYFGVGGFFEYFVGWLDELAIYIQSRSITHVSGMLAVPITARKSVLMRQINSADTNMVEKMTLDLGYAEDTLK
jgi:hypothetical protein